VPSFDDAGFTSLKQEYKLRATHKSGYGHSLNQYKNAVQAMGRNFKAAHKYAG
jgi:Neuraminidase (sialidase)